MHNLKYLMLPNVIGYHWYCGYWPYTLGRSVRLYTDGCVVDSGTGLMGPCKHSTCFLYVFSPQIHMRQCEHEYTLLEYMYDKLLCFIPFVFMSIFDSDEVCPALQSITVTS